MASTHEQRSRFRTLYGTISHGVARRVTELGVRMALGANRANVLWLVVREALMLVGVGAAVGLPLAFAASRSIASLLHGVRIADPATYVAAAALLVIVATLARGFRHTAHPGSIR